MRVANLPWLRNAVGSGLQVGWSSCVSTLAAPLLYKLTMTPKSNVII